MGDWMTVTIVGHIDPVDAPAARAFIDITRSDAASWADNADWDRFHCLCYSSPSMCGLGLWVPEAGGVIRAVGNLSERNYDVNDVAETLRELVAVAPSLRLEVHCGGSYESTACVATVTVTDGAVGIGPAEIATVGDGFDEQTDARVAALLGLVRGDL